MLKLFRKDRESEPGTVGYEAKRAIVGTFALYRGLTSDVKSYKKEMQDRKNKPYTVNPSLTLNGFHRCFLIRRVTVMIYFAYFFLGLAVITFSDYKGIALLVSSLSLSLYLGEIRHIHRLRQVHRNWELKSEPLSLSWSDFFKDVRKNPKLLIPIVI